MGVDALVAGGVGVAAVAVLGGTLAAERPAGLEVVGGHGAVEAAEGVVEGVVGEAGLAYRRLRVVAGHAVGGTRFADLVVDGSGAGRTGGETLGVVGTDEILGGGGDAEIAGDSRVAVLTVGETVLAVLRFEVPEGLGGGIANLTDSLLVVV